MLNYRKDNYNHNRHIVKVLVLKLTITPTKMIKNSLFYVDYRQITSFVCRPGSSVGIATDYGLDGPG